MNGSARFLDPRFALVLDFLAEAETDAEYQTRRKGAEEIARACGYTFDEACATLNRCADPPSASYLSTKPEAGAPIAIRGLGDPRAAEIVAALTAGPARSDRDVARTYGCSPTLVGRARAAVGLAVAAREVRRGDQCYAMRSRTTAARASDQMASPRPRGESPAADM